MSAATIYPNKIKVGAYFPTGFCNPNAKAQKSPTKDSDDSDSADSSARCEAKVDFYVRDSSHSTLAIEESRKASVKVTSIADGVYTFSLRAEFKLRTRDLCESDTTNFIVAFNDKELGVKSVKISRGAFEGSSSWKLATTTQRSNIHWAVSDGDCYRLNDFFVCTASLVAVVGAEGDSEFSLKRKRGRPSKRSCPYCSTGDPSARKTGVAKPAETIDALRQLLAE